MTLQRTIQRELRGGDTHCYVLTLSQLQYAHLTVQQSGIDVVIKILDPALKEITTADRPNGALGREGVSIIAANNGDHVLQIRSLEPSVNRARYSIVVDDLRHSLPRDTEQVLAERVIYDAERKRSKGSAEDLAAAIGEFEEGLKRWSSLRDEYEAGVANHGLGLAYRTLNENQKAISAFQNGAALGRKLGDRFLESANMLGAGWAFIYVGDTHQAIKSFLRAKELASSLNDRRGEAISLYGIGWAHALDGEDQRALDNFILSLALRRQLSDKRGQALTLTGIGKIYNRTNRNNEALNFLQRALELLAGSKGDARADALSAIGWVYVTLGQTRAAHDAFVEAIEIWRNIGDRTGEATSLYGLARTESQLGNLAGAQTHMARALEIVETMRAKGANQRLRTSYFALVQDYYEFEIELLMRLHQTIPQGGYAAAAFEVSERSRHRRLLDLLNESDGEIREGVDPRLINEEKLLSDKLNAAALHQRALRAGQHPTDQVSLAESKVNDLTAELEEVKAQIRQASPHYALLTQPHPISAPDVQKTLLDEHTVLLEYTLGKDRSYLWLISKHEIDSFELPARSEIAPVAQRVFELLKAREINVPGETLLDKRRRIEQADAEYPAAAMQLSKILIGPVAGRLKSRRLLVVSHSTLRLIPFAALPEPSTQSTPVPLVAHHEVISIPSASALQAFRQRVAQRTRPPHTIAIVADPVFANTDERMPPEPANTKNSDGAQEPVPASNYAVDSASALPRLFATRWEANSIANLVGPADRSVALDFAANEAFVTADKFSRYRILHFATHTLIDDEHPELSRIALSRHDASGAQLDGFLYAHEIYRLRLPVDLAVLSSCRGATGKEVKGEGLVAFAHAFMYAGAPRVIATLWNVNDTPTAEFMIRFYRKVLGPRPMTPSAALRATQLEFLNDKRWQAPYFWAAFTFQGDWRAL